MTGCVQWQLRMDFKLRLAAWAQDRPGFPTR